MKRRIWFALTLTLAGVALSSLHALADTHYVCPSGGHTSPFTNWPTAATNIQAAIDEAVDGDTVLVTNGVYDTGGVAIHGSMTNRIAITNAVMVRSVGGPEETFIEGNGPLGDSAVRCAYVGDGACIEGFTLMNGHTRTNGTTATEMSGGGAWCESTAVIAHCVLNRNSASRYGGGAAYGTVRSCVIVSNTARYGGGTYDATVLDSILSENTSRFGGGARAGTIRNCLVTGNFAWYGGGAYQSILQSCTVSGNTAWYGGGAHGATVGNSILYYNTATRDRDNAYGGLVEYTCIYPDPGGAGNITNAPGLAGLRNPLLMPGSPCVDAGVYQDWMTGGIDYDGEPRLAGNGVDLGCDELHVGGLTGPLTLSLRADYTNAAVGLPITFEVALEGRPSGYAWDWVDGSTTTNEPLTKHPFNFEGDYDVVCRAWNLEGGAAATLSVHVVSGYTNFVSPAGWHEAPYESWATAATNIQDAIDVQATLGGVVAVGEGVYESGGTVVYGSMSNRIAITKAITVCGMGGPENCVIVGSGPVGDSAVRGAYVGVNARLVGFTLTNGHTRESHGVVDREQQGGGVWCDPTGVVSNCLIVGNQAESGGGAFGGSLHDCVILRNHAQYWGGGYSSGTAERCLIQENSGTPGGGAIWSTLRSCVLVSNVVPSTSTGGGADDSTLVSCTVVHNTAGWLGGGTSGCAVSNSIVYFNAASSGDPNYRLGSMAYSCASPQGSGPGNIDADPGFLDRPGGNYRLSVASPCIDAGTNMAWTAGAVDLDGLPRIINGTVDMGAFESPSPTITSIIAPPAGPVITWASFTGAQYAVYGSTNLVDGYDLLLQDGIPAYPPENAFTDTVNGVELRGYAVEYTP